MVAAGVASPAVVVAAEAVLAASVEAASVEEEQEGRGRCLAVGSQKSKFKSLKD